MSRFKAILESLHSDPLKDLNVRENAGSILENASISTQNLAMYARENFTFKVNEVVVFRDSIQTTRMTVFKLRNECLAEVTKLFPGFKCNYRMVLYLRTVQYSNGVLCTTILVVLQYLRGVAS